MSNTTNAVHKKISNNPQKKRKMTLLELVVYSAIILAVIIGATHSMARFADLPILNTDLVEFVFYIINDLSIIYLIIPIFVIELIRYAIKKQFTKNLVLDSMTNIVTVFMFQLIEYVLGGLFILKLYTFAYEHRIFEALPLTWATILGTIILADFLYYLEHRFMHRVGIGWATHTVHHSSPHFNMSVAYRFGPLDGVFPLFFSVPMAFLGFDPVILFASELFVQVFQTALHTEAVGKLPRPIEAIFNTPSHHRVHHASNWKYLDKNYGGIFIIWDRMLGTFKEETTPVTYGITDPINSTNPFVVFFHGLFRLYKKVDERKGLKNKLLTILKPPGWSPKKTKVG